ncbi:MAG: cytochrome c class I precursor [Candidatus Tokpelaia sp. JSC189]|nr:MAG: cytochrome c class I precursor [Candidatus Tokpelaia sp. JSC189]
MIIAILLLAILFPDPAYADNAENGHRIFHRCIACHYADRKGNRIGPSLKNIMQRRAATEPGYRFSSAMVKASKKGLIWNKRTLTEYLHNPQAMVPGTRMASVKITSKKDIDDLIAYLKKVSQQ